MSDTDQYDFQAISTKDGTWAALTESWKRECEAAGEDFATYAEPTIETILPLVQTEHAKAWVFALKVNERFPALCQVNRAMLPGYDGPVIRVRFITLSPEYDLTEKTAGEYGRILVWILASVLRLAIEEKFRARHVKFHLASPADQQFFRALGAGLQGAEPFETVESHGAWLYIKFR